MSTILDNIVANRIEEIRIQKLSKPLLEILASINISYKCNSLAERLAAKGSSGIIAEFKRRSPSKGIINDTVLPEVVTTGYAQAGVSGLSVLTDSKFFGGHIEDLKLVRAANPLTPLLRKDFMVDEYQIYEARMLKADVILLIAAVLSKEEISRFTSLTHELGMEVLLEIHDENELGKIDNKVDIIGINNRNLKNFNVDLAHSLELLCKLPSEAIKISESGISEPDTVNYLRKKGFQGFLMGENFMKTADPGLACADFISKLKIV